MFGYTIQMQSKIIVIIVCYCLWVWHSMWTKVDCSCKCWWCAARFRSKCEKIIICFVLFWIWVENSGLFRSYNCCVSLIAGSLFNCDGFMAIWWRCTTIWMAAAATVCFQCMHNQMDIDFIFIIVNCEQTHRRARANRYVMLIYTLGHSTKLMYQWYANQFICF